MYVYLPTQRAMHKVSGDSNAGQSCRAILRLEPCSRMGSGARRRPRLAAFWGRAQATASLSPCPAARATAKLPVPRILCRHRTYFRAPRPASTTRWMLFPGRAPTCTSSRASPGNTCLTMACPQAKARERGRTYIGPKLSARVHDDSTSELCNVGTSAEVRSPEPPSTAPNAINPRASLLANRSSHSTSGALIGKPEAVASPRPAWQSASSAAGSGACPLMSMPNVLNSRMTGSVFCGQEQDGRYGQYHMNNHVKDPQQATILCELNQRRAPRQWTRLLQKTTLHGHKARRTSRPALP